MFMAFIWDVPCDKLWKSPNCRSFWFAGFQKGITETLNDCLLETQHHSNSVTTNPDVPLWYFSYISWQSKTYLWSSQTVFSTMQMHCLKLFWCHDIPSFLTVREKFPKTDLCSCWENHFCVITQCSLLQSERLQRSYLQSWCASRKI